MESLFDSNTKNCLKQAVHRQTAEDYKAQALQAKASAKLAAVYTMAEDVHQPAADAACEARNAADTTPSQASAKLVAVSTRAEDVHKPPAE